MNKVVYYLFSYAVSILTIYLSMALEPENFWVWLAFVFALLLAPVILRRVYPERCVTVDFTAGIVQMFVLVAVLVLAMPKLIPNDDYILAVTKSPAKANEIQELLTTKYRPTQRHILFYVPDNSQRIGVSIENNGRKVNREAVIELLNSDIMDDSVGINLNIKPTRNKKLMVKRGIKESERILYSIDGITYVHIVTSKPEITDKKLSLKYVNIHYETAPSADNSKINELVEKFANSVFENYSANITVTNDTEHWQAYELWEKAQSAFVRKEYDLSAKLLKQASQIDDAYKSDIERLAKVVEVEKKIKKYPNNYKYYIELADSQNPVLSFFSVSIHNPADAVKNYEKALMLNPNVVEVYERIGDAYSELFREYFDAGISCKDKAAEYYLKALSVGDGNNNIYSFLGEYYLGRKEYNTALMYYDKMDNSSCFPYDSNKKAYLYLKTGKFKDFYKETKCCNVLLCRLIRLNFKEDNSLYMN